MPHTKRVRVCRTLLGVTVAFWAFSIWLVADVWASDVDERVVGQLALLLVSLSGSLVTTVALLLKRWMVPLAAAWRVGYEDGKRDVERPMLRAVK